jgi:hypothetical protein
MASLYPRRVEVDAVPVSTSSLPMKVEFAFTRMQCDDVSLQQRNESVLKERSELLAMQEQRNESLLKERAELLAMQVSLLAQEKASLLAQQQAYNHIGLLRCGFTPPIIPAFMPPPGLSFSSQAEARAAKICKKQCKNVSFDHDSDRASTCSGSAGSSDVMSDSDSIGTTVIMRNIPNRFGHTSLAAVLDMHGFSGVYDLIYVPIDFATGVSFGYAFVNLASVVDADRFIASFDGFKWGGASKKVCSVVRCDDDESPSERVERYRNLPVMHSSMPDSFKPAMYSAGQRAPFPGPTKKLRAPRFQCPGKKD